MKRYFVLVLCLLTIFTFAACGNNDSGDEGGYANMTNPVTELKSLDEVNEAVDGIHMMSPEGVDVEDEYFASIDCGDYTLGEYRFFINGIRYTLRCGATTDDISGIYIDAKEAFGEPTADPVEYAEGEGHKIARWFNIDGQWTLAVDDDGNMDKDAFLNFAQQFVDYTTAASANGED